MPQAVDLFTSRLAEYKKLIDDDIDEYCESIGWQTSETYGEQASVVAESFTGILKRGGKRIRGVLTLVGYEMCGGVDRAAAIQAARAIEMMHAYMLVIDDIQDRASIRRGGPSAHKQLAALHRQQKWRGDAEHAGMSLALNAALLGGHGAEMILAGLPMEPELRIKALGIMNHTIMVTAHGQTHDIINEMRDSVTIKDIEKVMQWKTAHYSFLNPLHMGMVLAGAGCEDTNAITDYALNLGKAFQITDDLLIVADKGDSGKDPADDIREGKQTILTVYALEHAGETDAAFLRKCLGNQDLTRSEFDRCRDIMESSGAVKTARGAASSYAETARASLKQHAERWDEQSVAFLDQLALSVAARTA